MPPPETLPQHSEDARVVRHDKWRGRQRGVSILQSLVPRLLYPHCQSQIGLPGGPVLLR